MRSLVLFAVLSCLLAGCGKKPKFTGKSEDTAAVTPPQPAERPKASDKPKPAEKADKSAEKKNWIGDPRAKKADDPELPPESGGGGNRQPWVGQLPGGEVAKLPADPDPMSDPAGQPAVGKPVGGKPQPDRKGVLRPQPVPQPAPPVPPPAAGKAVTEADLNDVWIGIENFSQASGKMPSPALVYAVLVEAKSPAAELVKDGSIILTGANRRESVWAFERNAATQGGLIVTQNKVERVTAAEFARRVLGR